MIDARKNKINRTIKAVLQKHGVLKAALFGSFAKGKISAESDIDLLVEFPEGKSLLDLINLKLELEKLLRRRVDIVTYASLHPLMKDKIMSELAACRRTLP
jgi:predicted nucleotidyltransferase